MEKTLEPTVIVGPLVYSQTEPQTFQWSEPEPGDWTLTEVIEMRLGDFLGRTVRL